MTIGAGELDRRITVEVCEEVKDRSGDPVKTWPPEAGSSFPRWAKKEDSSSSEASDGIQKVREHDTTFTLRSDSQSRAIAPETSRFVYKDKVFEIVGVTEESSDRGDVLVFLCSTRPDKRGARGEGATSA